MLVTPVNRVVNSYLAQSSFQNQSKTNPAFYKASNFAQSNSISFTGLGFLKKFFSPPQIITTAEEVLEVLSKRRKGLYAYARENNCFISIPPKRYNKLKNMINGEIILKNDKTYAISYSPYNIQTKGYRIGISPEAVHHFLQRGLSKVTMIVDDGLQVLSLPKNEKDREAVLKAVFRSEQFDENIKNIINIDNVALEKQTEFLYNWTQEMIKDSNLQDLVQLSKQKRPL